MPQPSEPGDDPGPPRGPAQAARHPHDGVRPRHALCAHCGYHFGGMPITAGVITCPECGRPTPFDVRSIAACATPAPLIPLLRLIAWSAVAVLALGALTLCARP